MNARRLKQPPYELQTSISLSQVIGRRTSVQCRTWVIPDRVEPAASWAMSAMPPITTKFHILTK
jgi:hypothetical protein